MKQELFAVTGKPVLHSRSPSLQGSAFNAAGLPHIYTRLAADSAQEAILTAREIGFSGLNVTAPFKEEACRCCKTDDPALIKLQAVNTVVLSGGQIRAYNTDLYGIERSLEEHGAVFQGAKALVLGAGGAARAAIAALVGRGAEVTVTNRTVEKAKLLAEQFEVRHINLSEDELAKAVPEAQIIVSCLSPCGRVIPSNLLHPGQVILEGNYAVKSMLLEDARQAGATPVDGREWLLHQGARAFEHFTGAKPALEAMRAALLKEKRPKPKSIALIGFMGSGKSSVARELSALLKLPTVEADLEIEKKQAQSVSEIFSRHGEATFRDIEEEILSYLSGGGPMVLSCGGGVVVRAANRERLKQNFLTVWLWARPETILTRTASDRSRPLLQTEDREAAARGLLEKRKAFYTEAADLVVSTEGRSPVQIAEKIADEIHSAFHG